MPERQTIEDYDIDGYLNKAELTAARLYSTVRASLRAYDQLCLLEHQRRLLTAVHDCVAQLRSFQPLEQILTRVLAAALAVCPARLGVLFLENAATDGDRQHHFIHQGAEAGYAAADAVRMAVNRARAAGGVSSPMAVAGGWVLPIHAPRGLADGWLHVAQANPVAIERQARAVPARSAPAWRKSSEHSSAPPTLHALRPGTGRAPRGIYGATDGPPGPPPLRPFPFPCPKFPCPTRPCSRAARPAPPTK